MHLSSKVVAGTIAAAVVVLAWRGLPSPHEKSGSPIVIATPGISSPHAGERRRSPAMVASVVVYVAGEVGRPGLYHLRPGDRVDDAVRAARGPTSAADLVATNFAAPLADGDEVILYARGSAPQGSSTCRAARRTRSTQHPSRKGRRRHVVVADTPTAIVDLNTADAAALETLPGVGATLAARIVLFRDQNGRFVSPDDLLDVGGMTQAKYDSLAPFIRVR